VGPRPGADLNPTKAHAEEHNQHLRKKELGHRQPEEAEGHEQFVRDLAGLDCRQHAEYKGHDEGDDHARNDELKRLWQEPQHDIDRVFSIADAVTVMHEGKVLIDGTVEDARNSPEVQTIYIGSGSESMASKPRVSARGSQELLRCESVNTFYSKSHIIRDVSFNIHQGEILALLGRNGAGKSTLLKTLIGISPAASGSIQLHDRRIESLSAAEIARLGVAYVPQGRGLFSGMTVAQNIGAGQTKATNRRGDSLGSGQDFSIFPSDSGSLAFSCRLFIGWRAANGRDRTSPIGRYSLTPTRRTLRGIGASNR